MRLADHNMLSLIGRTPMVRLNRVARELGRGQRVATVLVDSRDRYLFTEKFTP